VYIKIGRLDINPHPISFLDDLLLFICVPSFFLYCMFSTLPGLAEENFVGNLLTNLLLVGAISSARFFLAQVTKMG
jgi:hypothetical protein